MGIQLVKEVLETPLGLTGSHAARTALIVMARYAVDDHTPPRYFKGWRPIASALELTGTNDSKRTAVARLWRRLADLDLIERVSRIDDNSNRLVATWTLRRDHWHTLRLERDANAARAEAVENLAGEVA